jgi:hypothetical protein
MPPVDVATRDARVLRAAKTVLANYTFHPLADVGSHRCVEVRGGSRPYVVTVDPAWGEGPRCTCPDHARAAVGGFCKHVIGVLLRDDTLRCQLLELFL